MRGRQSEGERRSGTERTVEGKGGKKDTASLFSLPGSLPRGGTKISRASKWLKASLPFFHSIPYSLTAQGCRGRLALPRFSRASSAPSQPPGALIYTVTRVCFTFTPRDYKPLILTSRRGQIEREGCGSLMRFR